MSTENASGLTLRVLVRVEDEALIYAVQSAKEYSPGAASHDSSEHYFYRKLTVMYVNAKMAQLQDVAEKGELIAFLREGIKRLRKMGEWPDWFDPSHTNLDRRTREPAQKTYTGELNNMMRGGNRTVDGRTVRVYYPNPDKHSPAEAAVINAVIQNLGVAETVTGDEEQS